MTAKTTTHPHRHPSEDDVRHLATWVLILIMYVVLFATLYLIWWKANPLWWA